MKLGGSKIFASQFSPLGQDNRGFEHSGTGWRSFLPSAEAFSNGARTPRRDRQSVIRNRSRGRNAAANMAAFVSRCFPNTIRIPARLRERPLEALFADRKVSQRLAHVLRKSGARVLGDLDGQRVGNFAWKKNCGLKTLQELDSLTFAFADHASSHTRRTTAERKAITHPRHDRVPFVIPKSIREFRFDQLPITKRLANVARSNRLRTLGDLHGRTRFELLQYRACGWRTLTEIQQLIERAICREFDVAPIGKYRAVVELLILLEQGIARLPHRDRQFLLARVWGVSFAEIGLRYGFTRAHVHKVVANALGVLRTIWGKRIPGLLEMMRTRCFSIPNASGLTPELLEQWVGDASERFCLSRKAQLRLIAALDKNIPVSLD